MILKKINLFQKNITSLKSFLYSELKSLDSNKFMYTLELTLRYTPFPISIQKKEYNELVEIFDIIKHSMRNNDQASTLIDLKCDKMKDKSIVVLSSEIIAAQIYEKSSIAGGSKRPGFSFEE